MEYDPSDSSGTDDDLPPSHQNRGVRGRVAGNGRAIVGSIPYPRLQNDMEAQIHRLEQEAYSSILRAFKAQSDAITWEKESLITELRKELRLSDEEHRELLNRVNADDVIRRIREWRQAGGGQTGMLNNTLSDVPLPSPSISASRKRQKTSQPLPSLSLGAPSSALHSQPAVGSMLPSAARAKKGSSAGPKSKKPKSGPVVVGASSMKSGQYDQAGGPSGRGQVLNRNLSGALVAVETAEQRHLDPLIGRKVMTRWPDDNNFYEAVITDFNPSDGRHALVYDIGTSSETWEWVNLKDISAEDIRWDGEDPGINPSGRGAHIKRTSGRGGAIPCGGRGRGSMKNIKKDFPPSQNGVGKKNSGDIEILNTDSLIKEVDKIFSTTHPDHIEMEKAKKMLKDHEQSLVDAIARIAEASDGESEGDEHQFSHGLGQSVDRVRRNLDIAGGTGGGDG